MIDHIPRILIVDDLFGRTVAGGRNEQRADLCGELLLEDVSADDESGAPPQKIHSPVARAVFFRGQKPARAIVGDVVENDLDGTMAAIERGWNHRPSGSPPWAAVLLDLCFYTGSVTPESDSATPGMPEGCERDEDPAHFFGLMILDAAHRRFPELPLIILSSKSRQEVSRSFSELGALGFIARGERGTLAILREYLDRHGLLLDTTGRILGCSIPLLLALRAARRSGEIRRHVLIRGEQGTGKELMARYIHDAGSRDRERPLVEVDSGTLSPELFASELFGHRKGAFTGAAFDRKGRMLLADGGDLFLDEIGNMPPDVQVGLLRVLDGGQVVAVGAERGQEVDVRVLSATNVDIEQSAVNGRFRSDLLDRLRVGGIIRLPPLRQRRADIPLLAEKFLEDALRTLPYARIREITPEAMAMLTADEWPGNVRELESCVFGAVREHSDVEFLYPAHFKRSSAAYVAVAPAVHEVQARSTATLSSLMEEFEGLAADRLPATELAGAAVRAQRVQARLLARLLLGALRATARITPNEPQGRAMIHPAVKLLLGDAGITASEAADVVKRFLSVAPEAIEDLMRERLLSEALASALRLRPRSGGARSNRGRPEGV